MDMQSEWPRWRTRWLWRTNRAVGLCEHHIGGNLDQFGLGKIAILLLLSVAGTCVFRDTCRPEQTLWILRLVGGVVGCTVGGVARCSAGGHLLFRSTNF